MNNILKNSLGELSEQMTSLREKQDKIINDMKVKMQEYIDLVHERELRESKEKQNLKGHRKKMLI